MDNVTHSLAGLLLAESAVRLRAHRERSEPSPRFRVIATISSIIAANLPDADLFYTGIGGDRLRYMLHHRGHTHTVVIAMIGAVLLWVGALVVWRWRARASASVADRRWLFGLVLVGTLSHLVLDWTNSYGVHPFWPVDDRWRYGDAVFIIEPWLWVVSIPALIFAITSRVGRLLLSLILVAVLALAWRVDLVSAGAAAALTLGALVFALLARSLRPGSRILTAIGGWCAVTLVMAAGCARARATTLRATQNADPNTQILDVVVSPLPANPICATVITVERRGAVYRTATARVSAVPTLLDAARCGSRQASVAETPSRRSTTAVHWESEWSAPIEQLAVLTRESCRALAAMRFIRVPIWRPVDDTSFLLGDARFGSGAGNGFTDVRVPRRSPVCPAAVPPWTPPRSDLLGL